MSENLNIEPTLRNKLLRECIDNIYNSMQTLVKNGIISEDGNAFKFYRILTAKLYLIKAGIKD